MGQSKTNAMCDCGAAGPVRGRAAAAGWEAQPKPRGSVKPCGWLCPVCAEHLADLRFRQAEQRRGSERLARVADEVETVVQHVDRERRLSMRPRSVAMLGLMLSLSAFGPMPGDRR